ncbi:hypothetical protein APASM_5540 [Actinosynnema pretiosum subsp. pretiosum]|nr:hypothetical protein APASM_5540 [Actinosynnema pretiosum subsp. pretiosum]
MQRRRHAEPLLRPHDHPARKPDEQQLPQIPDVPPTGVPPLGEPPVHSGLCDEVVDVDAALISPALERSQQLAADFLPRTSVAEVIARSHGPTIADATTPPRPLDPAQNDQHPRPEQHRTRTASTPTPATTSRKPTTPALTHQDASPPKPNLQAVHHNPKDHSLE